MDVVPARDASLTSALGVVAVAELVAGRVIAALDDAVGATK
jgi:hypothetical protein